MKCRTVKLDVLVDDPSTFLLKHNNCMLGFQTSKAVPIVQGLNKNTLNQVKNKELVIGS